MGKQNQGTKFLCKKSNYSLNSQSKTCSGTSQFVNKNGTFQLKYKRSKPYYYVDNGKLKRDLSIETDKCILRAYYKKKFGRFKPSLITAEAEAITEQRHDHNSCGDSMPKTHQEKTRLNIDITSLVMDNLNDLLNAWIKKYLLNSNESEQKIKTILDSILHKLEVQSNSSSCTYTLDIKINDKNKLKSNSIKDAKVYVFKRISCQTVPVTGKRLKLISTLSIPRNTKRHVNSTHLQHVEQTARKIRYKNVFLTVSRSSTFLLNSSSFNLLSISTKSFTKRFATYDSQVIKTCKKHELLLLPKSSCSVSTADTFYQEKDKIGLESAVNPNVLEMEPVESLVKSIYADDPANITSTDKHIYKENHDHFTMTDTNFNLKDIPFLNLFHKLDWKKAKHTAETGTLKVGNKVRKSTNQKTLSHMNKIRKTKSKKKPKYIELNNHYEKCNSSQNENYLLKDLRNVLKHFTHYSDSKNIKFDIKINVFPELENKQLDDANNENTKENTPRDSNSPKDNNVSDEDITRKIYSISKNSLPKCQPEIISILDGAISQSNYIMSKEESYKSIDNNIKTGNVLVKPKNISRGLEIAKDISELRVIIRDLAITTEKFVKEHLEHQKNKPVEMEGIKINDDLRTSTVSRSVQYSSVKSQIISGLKLKKEPKKKEREFKTRLTKKSISYDIIESESLLKVTDMTSAATEIGKDILINKAYNCSLPKSKSQIEITVGQSHKKVLAYYYDELMKSGQCDQNTNIRCACSSKTCKYTKCTNGDNEFSPLIVQMKCQEDDEIFSKEIPASIPHKEYRESNDPVYSCSSVYIDVEDQKKIAVRTRNGMSFWEGLFYCILLWIPVVIIFCLLYVFVRQELIQKTNPAIGRTHPSQRSSNNSLFHITLSDLGF